MSAAHSTSNDETRLKKEAAVRAILAGERTGVEVAEEWGISRQAVHNWVQRYREQGDLKQQKRGRKKFRPLSEKEERAFFAAVKKAYAERGFRVGSKIPRRDRLKDTELAELLGEVTPQNCSLPYTRRVVKDMEIPIYFEGIPHLPEDFDYVGDHSYLRDPHAPTPEKGKATRPKSHKTPAPEPKAVPSEDDDDRESDGDDDFREPPTNQEDYAQWVEETRALMIKRGYDPEAVYSPKAGKGPNVRTGKHAKGNTNRPKKHRRKKKGKKRR